MGFSGEFKRVPALRLRELLADPESIGGELYPDETPEDAGAWFSIEKSFDGIRYLVERLSETGVIPAVDPVPWFAPLLAGSRTGAELHYGDVCYRTPEQVGEIAAALSRVLEDDLRQVYDPDVMMAESVYPETWDRGDGEFEYLWEHYQALRDFYAEAARHGEGVLLWLA